MVQEKEIILPKSMLTPRQHTIKRTFDLAFTIILLPILLPLLCFIWILATLSIGKNGWFVQTRIGKEGRPFNVYKIRTLKGSNHQDILEMKLKETHIGKWLRKTKLDEIPQIINVLKGDMSWVGPRPDVPGYADTLEKEDRIILSVRPGITGPATLKYKNEDQLLLKQKDPRKYNDQVIWPDKVHINKNYVQNWSLGKDFTYLWQSVF